MYKILANTLIVARQVISMPTCHSTNDMARQMAEKPDTAEGAVVICHEQTKGKGQRGNSWEAEPGKNLTLSVVLKPGFLRISEQFYLNMIVSLAVRDTVKYFLPKAEVKVKWPNDVLVDNQKVAGILIENNITRNRIEHAIVGVGLNVNQKNFRVPRATSLALRTGVLEPEVVFDSLMRSLEYQYLRLKAGRKTEIKADYLQHLFGYRQTRKYRTEYQFEGRIEDLADSGHLVVSTPNGLQQYDLKEIEFIY